MPHKTLQNILPEHHGKWVVMDEPDYNIISAADTLEEAAAEAQKQGVAQPDPIFVPASIKDEAKYQGEYVILHPDTRDIIAHDKDLSQALQAAKEQGIEQPIVHPVQSPRIIYQGNKA